MSAEARAGADTMKLAERVKTGITARNASPLLDYYVGLRTSSTGCLRRAPNAADSSGLRERPTVRMRVDARATRKVTQVNRNQSPLGLSPPTRAALLRADAGEK